MVSQCVHWPDARRVGWASDVKIVHTANGDLCPRIPVGVYYVVVVQLRAEWQKKTQNQNEIPLLCRRTVVQSLICRR